MTAGKETNKERKNLKGSDNQRNIPGLTRTNFIRRPIFQMMASVLTRLLPFIYKHFGPRGVRALQFIFYKIGRDRVELMKKTLDIDPLDARSIGRFLDVEDELFGAFSVWEKETRGHAIKKILRCPAEKIFARHPEVCNALINAMEYGTLYGLNPDLFFPRMETIKPIGCEYCEVHFILPDLPEEEAGTVSPQATPDAFPAHIIDPKLRLKLYLLAVKSAVKAVWILLTKGTEQEMARYDFFKYRPDRSSKAA